MILHIPHSQTDIDATYRDLFVLDDAELQRESILMADAYTDELFEFDEATKVTFPYSRLLVDVERFPNDDEEPMSQVGMGMIYTHTAYGQRLKRDLSGEEKSHLKSLYQDHHDALNGAVEMELEQHGRTMIVDCHSFPSKPQPCDQSQKVPRQDFCIGADEFHTPDALVDGLVDYIKESGHSVAVNEPYVGTIVPLEHYRKTGAVTSVMIEVNRSLYMDEVTGEKNRNFYTIQIQIHNLLALIHSLI